MSPFLSAEWFQVLDDQAALAGDLQIAPALQALVLNLTVTGTEGGSSTDICLDGGRIRPGHRADALAKLTMPADVARRVLLRWDQAAGMSAMLGGKMKVEGNRFKLMAMQTTRLSERHRQLLRDVEALTA